jgi:TrpR-related protein YerC/YecD
MTKTRKRDIEELYEAILCMQSVDEANSFFRDLLTETEIREFAERWKAARMLTAKVPYVEITKTTGLSSTTVARVARWVKKGTGGYTLAMKRLERK